jgi:hypothetical protein
MPKTVLDPLDFQIVGENAQAPFTLKLHRGEGMVILAMNWRDGQPPPNFVGFALEYKEPSGVQFYEVKNRLNFLDSTGEVDLTRRTTRLSPIQKFRWVHLPRNADLQGKFVYRVTPVFMDDADKCSYGEPQEAAIVLRSETYPGQLNAAFTRGFVSSQAFVDLFESKGPISTLLPARAEDGLTFVPTHPSAADAYPWMGFEARAVLLDILDRAIADHTARVSVAAYELNEPTILGKLEQLGSRLRIIIDDSGDHGAGSCESAAAQRLRRSAGDGNVKRQHMGQLQHNKSIVVDGDALKVAVCGSTNFSWRGLYVQANNALTVWGEDAIRPFTTAFESYWSHDDVAGFGSTPAARPTGLGLSGIDAEVTFSPHRPDTVQLEEVADDIEHNTTSSLLWSMAFLYQTKGRMRIAITKVTENEDIFVYGISDREVGGLDVLKPDGNHAPISPAALDAGAPPPFSPEPTGGQGVRLHHKFAVVDFDKPTARVYLGSYNFSTVADTLNGENLLRIRDRRVAVSYAVEAIRLFDHYHFRLALHEAGKNHEKALALARPPRKPGEKPWWDDDYTVPYKIRDRELFA